MSSRLGFVLGLISLPVLIAAVEATMYYQKNRDNGAIVSSGRRREFTLYVPKSYDSAKRTALVISLHGAGLWGAAQREISRWDKAADEHGFIVVYPSARKRGPRTWQLEAGVGLSPDVRFIADLIDTLSARYNIDPSRIYSNGLSNGGGMSFALSCTISGRIAAVGLVAAAQTQPFSWCPDPRPVPMISFHGTADSLTLYKGGKVWLAPNAFPNVPVWTAKWAQRNRCAPNPVDSVVAPNVTRRSYTKCADGADVLLYTIHGGGHTWPGGTPGPEWFIGRTNTDIDATRVMWAFFREHPLRH